MHALIGKSELSPFGHPIISDTINCIYDNIALDTDLYINVNLYTRSYKF